MTKPKPKALLVGRGSNPKSGNPHPVDGTQNLLESAARVHAESEALMAEAREDFAIESAELAKMSREEKQALATSLRIWGLSLRQTATVLGMAAGQLHQWFNRETDEMARFMKQSLSSDATKTIPEAWRTLKALLHSPNEETRRKTALDLLRAAGTAVDPGQGGVTLNVNAKAVMFSSLSVSDLEKQLREVGAALGPKGSELVEAELLAVRSKDGISKPPVAARQPGAGAESPEAPGPRGGDPEAPARSAD